ncbi:hepatoma-derived growth factor-related protein 2-like [Patiria miniata]|uniref:Zinc finger CW-type PWWP domain protein 1 n=1 Tax=Patiria miniata TaxID=46514 RepID=A0A914AFK1_PATMI|nr:hepatoma-derived growth factor-related protein 2-like [Patiria miniata]
MEAENKTEGDKNEPTRQNDDSELETIVGMEALVNVDEEIKESECVERVVDVERNIPSANSVSDEEYNELCDAVLQRRKKTLADRPGCGPDEDLEDPQSEEEELQDVDQQQQQTDNIHSDLVTPELSAEEKESLPMPPKLSHKRSHKKKTPQADRRKRSGRKLEYQSSTQSVPLHKAIKRKRLPKSDPKPKKKRKGSDKKKKLQERTVHEDGTWVQCMHSECLKWRYLSDVTDPALIPEHWVCKMNTDSAHNSCEHPEEDYHSLEFVFTKFTEGSIVWAKMQGFPWWPAMVEEDPDTGTYLEQEDTDTYPTHYHVVFLDKNVSRTWLKSTFIRKYDPGKDEQTHAKGRDYKQQVSQAVARANKALSMNVQERIKTFGFSHTFKGKIVDNSQESSIVEVVDVASDSDHESDDVDVEFDLEILGLDVDEILEEAEALLSEAGETIQSLQDTPLDEEAPKETKKRRKSKKITDGEAREGNIDKECKTKRQYKKKSLKDISDQKKKKHKSHHHHSKKNSKEKEAGITAGSNDDTAKHMDEECRKSVGDIQASESEIRSKIINDEVKEDGSTKKSKKQHVKKSCLLNKKAAGSTGEDDAMNQCKNSDPDARTKQKKPRKPRVKKSHVEVEPKTNIAPAVVLKAEESPQTSTSVVESEKQESKKTAGDVRPKVKKVRRPRVESKENNEQKPAVVPKETASVKESENPQQPDKSDGAAVPKEKKEKKVRKPRVKKSDGEVEPKVKKPRAKKFSAKMNTGNLNKTDTPTAESEKIQDVRESDTNSKPRVKKPRAKKSSAAKPSADPVKTCTAEDMSDRLNIEAHGSPNTRDDDSKTKTKKKSKTTEAGPKMKPAFKTPSKKLEDVVKKPKKSSFAVPLVRKDEQLSKKFHQKETTKDKLSNNMENHALMSVEGRIDKDLKKEPPKSDTTTTKTGPEDAGVSKQRAKKFSIKKKANLPLSESTSSAEISVTDASPCINQNPTPPAEPTRDADCTFNQQPQKLEKNPPKKGTAKKFSIKHKTAVSKASSVAHPHSEPPELMNKVSPDTSRNENPGNEVKTLGINEPTGVTKKPSPKKLNVKRKPSSEFGEATNLKSGIDAKDSISPSPKKMKAERQEQHYVDDEEFLLNLDEDLLDDDTVLVVEDRQRDRVDVGEDSDDFSMEDLEDWPKDQDTVDEPSQGDPNKLLNQTSGSDTNPQSFEIVEE